MYSVNPFGDSALSCNARSTALSPECPSIALKYRKCLEEFGFTQYWNLFFAPPPFATVDIQSSSNHCEAPSHFSSCILPRRRQKELLHHLPEVLFVHRSVFEFHWTTVSHCSNDYSSRVVNSRHGLVQDELLLEEFSSVDPPDDREYCFRMVNCGWRHV